MKIVVTGGSGFLGWHLRTRLSALTRDKVVSVDSHNWSALSQFAEGADVIIHLAGVNRASDQEIEHGNIELATDVAHAVQSAAEPPRVVYANSVQAGDDTPYGRGKAQAGALLEAACATAGSQFADVRLPNLFGEHGRPNYNSFVATFIDKVVKGERPDVVDRPINLLHAQRASQALIDAIAGHGGVSSPVATPTTVRGVLDQLRQFKETYKDADIPALGTPFDVDLFNTYRAAIFPAYYPIALQPRADDRGTFVETVRSRGSQGQTSVSTTKPKLTRGEHYHLSKIERFVVLSGSARISLRRALTNEVISFDVSGTDPVAIDMPTMWIHNIRNTGSSELTTLFWTQDLYDPCMPDTYWEAVSASEVHA